jgi:anti-sigma factor RsiW
MKCGQARRLFGAYWDDELTQAEREWLEAHFAACDGCRSEYERLSHTLELVGSLPRADVAPGLADRALLRARRTAAAPDRLPVAATPRWIPITAAAALLAVATATVLQWSGTSFGPRTIARVEPSVPQPTLVAGTTQSPAAPSQPARTSSREVAKVEAVAAVPDSLFDPSEDIEFILDPVAVRKGRPHPASRLAPEKARGEQAVITF